MNSHNKKLLCFFGHHKCGTQWVQGILREVAQEMGWLYGHAHNEEIFNYDFEEFIKERKFDIFSYTNAKYQYIKDFNNFKGFHVIRDPRDIVVSAYYSHLYSHPVDNYDHLKKEREILQKMSKDEGLIQEMEFNQRVFEDMERWNYDQDHVMEIKLEDLSRDPYGSFVDIFRFLGIVSESRPTYQERWNHLLAITSRTTQKKLFSNPLINISLKKIPYEIALGIIYENRFQKKTKGRTIGEEDVKSHYRKGVAGDWKNHFNEDHINFFKDKYGQLLINLGYEKDENW
ncbi:MAG: sulfotransferase domain-containing protein [Crocosphaera sp.]|nr:sulfotransferase domain-containing protein [Crocosphaera sp.]